jgi:myo-inositol-1(or 4)-monophosphatase
MPSQRGPEAAQVSAAESVDADWVAICRRIVAAQRELFAEVTGSAARTEYEGVGEGGDWALALDRRCEDAVFAELEALAGKGASFTAVSEERGEVAFGEPGAPLRVVVDPIDGSLNVRRTIPSHSFSLAVARGDSMADVEIGYVYDFGAGEEFVARRGDGATLDGEPLRSGPTTAGDRSLEVVGLEAAKPAWMGPPVEALAENVYRLRVVGSLAIALCWLAAGRLDGMLGLRPARSVDVAAGQLIAQEAGATVSFGGGELEAARLGLEERYQVAGAWEAQALEVLLAAQRLVEDE